MNMVYWSDNIDIWQMAAAMCAEDVCFWGTWNPKTKDWDSTATLALNTNDVFAPAADAEIVEPTEVKELYDLWLEKGSDGLWEWASKKNGMVPFGWRNREKTPELPEERKALVDSVINEIRKIFNVT